MHSNRKCDILKSEDCHHGQKRRCFRLPPRGKAWLDAQELRRETDGALRCVQILYKPVGVKATGTQAFLRSFSSPAEHRRFRERNRKTSSTTRYSVHDTSSTASVMFPAGKLIGNAMRFRPRLPPLGKAKMRAACSHLIVGAIHESPACTKAKNGRPMVAPTKFVRAL